MDVCGCGSHVWMCVGVNIVDGVGVGGCRVGWAIQEGREITIMYKVLLADFLNMRNSWMKLLGMRNNLGEKLLGRRHAVITILIGLGIWKKKGLGLNLTYSIILCEQEMSEWEMGGD